MTHEETLIAAIEKVLPAVVSIAIGKDATAVERSIPEATWEEIEKTADKNHTKVSRDEIIGHLPHMADGTIQVGFGSGFIVSADGYILTNKHVVIDADAIYSVTTTADDRFVARVLARDPLNDVAILKIEGDAFPFANLGDSSAIRLGQTAIALGNALGEFQNTASAGIISGLSRAITALSDDEIHAEHLRGLFQTDAAINPGNSGGPLVNIAGEVIGINSAIVHGAQNIGFAIPINRAKKDLKDVAQFGKIKRPLLGLRYIPITTETKKRLGLSVDHGALVAGEKIPGRQGVLANSPAAKAGIKDGDIILAVNGQPIRESFSLEDALETSKIGDTMQVEFLRAGETMSANIVLEERK